MPRQKAQNLLATIDELPPFAVYALARRRGTRPTLKQLVAASGLPQRTFTRISRKLSWASVQAGRIEAFCKACGVNLLAQGKHRDFVRHSIKYQRPFSHLSNQQLKTFGRQCAVWKQEARA